MGTKLSTSSLVSCAGRSILDLDKLGDDSRAELIDGVLYQLPMTSLEHGHIASVVVMTVGAAYQLGHQGDWWIQGENDFEVQGEVYPTLTTPFRAPTDFREFGVGRRETFLAADRWGLSSIKSGARLSRTNPSSDFLILGQ